MSNSPAASYIYGNIEDGHCLTIDVFENPRQYQARYWIHGDTKDLVYFNSFEDCVDWFRSFETPWHGRAIGLAPQHGGYDPQTGDYLRDDWSWVPIDESQANPDEWWEGDIPADQQPAFILFDDMREDLNT